MNWWTLLIPWLICFIVGLIVGGIVGLVLGYQWGEEGERADAALEGRDYDSAYDDGLVDRWGKGAKP